MAKSTKPSQAKNATNEKVELKPSVMPSFEATIGQDAELPTAPPPIETEEGTLEIAKAPEESTGEQVTFTAVATDVKPLATTKPSNPTSDNVALKKNGRIIVQAVSRKQAESICKNNPAITIA